MTTAGTGNAAELWEESHTAFRSLSRYHDFRQSLTMKYLVKVKMLIPYNPAARLVVLNKERSGSHMGDICQYLETLLMVTSGLAGVGEREDVCYCNPGGRGAAAHPTANRSSLSPKVHMVQRVNSAEVGKLSWLERWPPEDWSTWNLHM